MATQTKNYGLILPGQEDFYNVDDFNSNATKIDNKLFVQEQEIIGVGKKLDVIGQNVTANGTNITGVGQKVDALGAKLGTPQDTSTDTIFGTLANKKEAVYVANKSMVQQELKNVYIEGTKEESYVGLVTLGHFYAEADGEIYLTGSVNHNNQISGNYHTKIYSGYASEDFRNAPAASMYKKPEPTALYRSSDYTFFDNGGILHVEKGQHYDFVLFCGRLGDVHVSFQLCYELKKP